MALLIGCGLRRAELVGLDVDHLQQRDARWVVPDLLGKGNRVRTVTIPAGVKARIDLWTAAARICEGLASDFEAGAGSFDGKLPFHFRQASYDME